VVAGIQGFEIMAIAAVGNNLITYVFGEMHFPLSQAANVVTNFVGTIFLLSLIGGFLSDSYLGCFWTMLTFGFVELSVSTFLLLLLLMAASTLSVRYYTSYRFSPSQNA
jgi:dipeptide/tripeptide permease